MKLALTLFISSMLISLNAFSADIYKCMDDRGQSAFVDGKAKAFYKNCTLLMLGDPSPPSNTPANRAPSASPTNFPKVDKQTQTSRDNKRKEILQDELSSEKKSLTDAKKVFDENKKNAELFKSNNLKEPYKITEYENNLQRLQSEVTTHEKNIQLLQKELDSIK